MSQETIVHTLYNAEVIQIKDDGYINITALAKAYFEKTGIRRDTHEWLRSKRTQESLEHLSTKLNIPVSELVRVVKGGFDRQQGTYVHPRMSVRFAIWLSDEIGFIVEEWIDDWKTGKLRPMLPYHLRRYLANRDRIPFSHFSIIAELTIRLIAPLESQGYRLPENMLPDISEGLIFNRWLREEKGLNTDELITYAHVFEDGRRVRAKMYPIEVWPDFIKHLYQEWLPHRAQDYFQKRDPTALPFLPKLLANRLTKSLTDLLKEHNSPISARRFNQILLELGILEEKTRPSVTKGTKQYKALTEAGSIYGKNEINPLKPEETQPRYYVDTFQKLLEQVEIYLAYQ